jgi:hypothetical protein
MPIPKLSDAGSERGAQMGRRDVHAIDRTVPIKFHIAYMPFSDGCYDRGGAYWGSPANLWRAVSTEEVACASNWDGSAFPHRVELYFRIGGPYRPERLKAQIREAYPNAKFFR